MLTVYEKKGKCMTTNKDKPLLLFVSTKHTIDGTHVKISGIENPLPFKEAVIKISAICIRDWLIINGWVPIGHEIR